MVVRSRDGRLDSLKGFLILLVILGHIIGESEITHCNSIGYWFGRIKLWIYLFHMPLFVLLSGYFSKRKSSTGEFFQSLKEIALTLLIFQTISLLFQYFLKQDFTLLYLVIPYWTLWYLLSLIFWRIILQFTPERLLQKPFLILAIVSIIAIFSGLFLPFGIILSLQRTLSFLPFFLLGYYMGQSKIIVPMNIVTKVSALVVILIMSCLVFCGAMPEHSNRLLLGSLRLSMEQIPAKLFLFTCSILMSLSFFVVFKELSVLAKIGRDSLFYYLYHGIIIRFIVIPVFKYFNLPWNLITLFSIFLIIVISLWFMSKSKLLFKLTNPLK